MDTTTKLKLPFLIQSQAQKEITVNESLYLLDFFAQPVVLGLQISPPASAVNGDAYIINGIGSGIWLGKNNHVAIRKNNAWEFIPPFIGMSFFSISNAMLYRYANDVWTSIDDELNTVKQELDALKNRVLALEGA